MVGLRVGSVMVVREALVSTGSVVVRVEMGERVGFSSVMAGTGVRVGWRPA
jgi:hypothetical protein